VNTLSFPLSKASRAAEQAAIAAGDAIFSVAAMHALSVALSCLFWARLATSPPRLLNPLIHPMI